MGSKEVRGGEREWSRIKEAHCKNFVRNIFLSSIKELAGIGYECIIY
jgi:hypothetical protein